MEIVIDSSCRDELARVLAYDRFGLTEAVQSRMLAEVDRLCTFLRGLRYTAADQLPRCSDPDDIKFLALVE
ncbi:MAG: PIN domain-containing protein, partial [Burkholderiales bacterium]|nr:PIN domain-containing protein [Burkholderiales bacterium]